MKREIERLDSLHKQLLETVSAIDASQFERRPSESEWSVAEIVHHLCIGDEWMAEEIQKGLECPPQRLGMLRQIFKVPAWMVGIRLVRVKAPKKAEPLNPPPRETLIDNYKRGRTKLKDLALRIGRERLEQL